MPATASNEPHKRFLVSLSVTQKNFKVAHLVYVCLSVNTDPIQKRILLDGCRRLLRGLQVFGESTDRPKCPFLQAFVCRHRTYGEATRQLKAATMPRMHRESLQIGVKGGHCPSYQLTSSHRRQTDRTYEKKDQSRH